MPVLKVYGVPGNIIGESGLELFCKKLQAAVARVEQLELDESDVTVFFPPDLLSKRFGKEIIVEIAVLFAKPQRTDEIRNFLCAAVGIETKIFFPGALVEVFINPPYDPQKGFWASP